MRSLLYVIRDDPMSLYSLLVLALTLKTLLTLGNAQPNHKKSPIQLIRNNSSSKDANREVPSSPPAPAPALVRPPTAIDPLSHVSLQSAPLQHEIFNSLQVVR